MHLHQQDILTNRVNPDAIQLPPMPTPAQLAEVAEHWDPDQFGPPHSPHVDRAWQYARDVVDRVLPAGRYIRLAAKRTLDDLERCNQADATFYFSYGKAEHVCRFAEKFGHTKGDWALKREKLKLEPWQCFALVNPFGFLRTRDGKRRFRVVEIYVPRKNGKSALTAVVMLYMLCADGEHGAEVYCGANSEKQAQQVFAPAKKLTDANPAFRKRFGAGTSANAVHVVRTSSRMEALTRKPGDGASPSCAAIDEYHEFKSNHLVDTMITGMGARSQPLLWIISTAGFDMAGPCFNSVLSGRKLVQGIEPDDTRFYMEYGLDLSPEGDEEGFVPDDWTDIETARKCNPNYGVSVFPDFLEDRLRDALRDPREQAKYKTKHLNMWVQSSDGYFNMQNWISKCGNPELRIDEFAGYPCYMGIDMSQVEDITAIQLVFVVEPKKRYVTFGSYFLPEDRINDPAFKHYKAWELDNQLIQCPGHRIRDDQVFNHIADLRARFDVREIAVDQSGASWLLNHLIDDGADVYGFAQNGYQYSEPTKFLAALINGGEIEHNSAPNGAMTWMMSNVVAKEYGDDNIKPSKTRSDKKIDGPQALIMALSRAMANVDHSSVYDKRGLWMV